MLEEFFDLTMKLDIALKNIVNFKDKFSKHDNKDHIKSTNVNVECNQHCEDLEAEIASLREDLEKSNKRNEELLQAFEEQENGPKEEILKLKEQVEEGIRVEEYMKKQYLEKEKKYKKMKVEVDILKGKLEEKDKHLRFQDNAKILDNILSSQRSTTIKNGLGFHESVEGESSSQGEAMNSNEKS